MLGNGTHTLPDMDTDTIQAYFLDTADHTTSLSLDIDEADITNAAQVPGGTFPAGVALGTKTVGTVGVGVFMAANTVFSSLSGDSAEEICVWQTSGTDTTSPLIVNFDTATGLNPMTPNGGDVTIVWNGSGIFQV